MVDERESKVRKKGGVAGSWMVDMALGWFSVLVIVTELCIPYLACYQLLDRMLSSVALDPVWSKFRDILL
jgi:hypothetical protein